MFVAATSRCFSNLNYDDALRRLVDLEYTNFELMIAEGSRHVTPQILLANMEAVVALCRESRRLDICAISFDMDMSDMADYFRHFEAVCRLAKATRVVTITVRSGELGTPFNEEIDRLAYLVSVAEPEGIRVAVLTEIGRMTQDPDTAVVFCNNVSGLGVTLDPSHYIHGPHKGGPFEQVMPYVYHVRLRDTSKEQLQVQIGQGEVEYGRLIAQLAKVGYDRALCVDLEDMPDLDQWSEMRKMRLLLESLL